MRRRLGSDASMYPRNIGPSSASSLSLQSAMLTFTPYPRVPPRPNPALAPPCIVFRVFSGYGRGPPSHGKDIRGAAGRRASRRFDILNTEERSGTDCALDNVRYLRQFGEHILIASFTAHDPTRTSLAIVILLWQAYMGGERPQDEVERTRLQ